MVVITTRAVTVPQPLIVPVPVVVVVIVIVVDRRVLVAGLTTAGVGITHARQLSKAVWL
jgi:hypothetical protein